MTGIELSETAAGYARDHLVLKAPNVSSFIAFVTGASWQWVSPPAHLYLYSPKTLESLLKKAGYQPLAFRSRQGDANNNPFAIVSGIGKQALSRKGEESLSDLRRSLPVRFVEAACEVFYYPLRISIDPWLGTKLRQPELYALAVNASWCQ